MFVHIAIRNNHTKFRLNLKTFRFIFRGGHFAPPPQVSWESGTSPLRWLKPLILPNDYFKRHLFLSIFSCEYQEYSKRERFHIKNREQTDNQQTHRCKKLKLLPTPTKDSWGILFITLLVQNYGLFLLILGKKTNSNSIFGQKWLS